MFSSPHQVSYQWLNIWDNNNKVEDNSPHLNNVNFEIKYVISHRRFWYAVLELCCLHVEKNKKKNLEILKDYLMPFMYVKGNLDEDSVEK